jgi:hypothetical protein
MLYDKFAQDEEWRELNCLINLATVVAIPNSSVPNKLNFDSELHSRVTYLREKRREREDVIRERERKKFIGLCDEYRGKHG